MSSETPATSNGPAFTARELEILSHAWSCLVEPPKVDYDKLAEACSMSNPRSASNAWANIKKKILAAAPPKADGEDGEAGDTPKKTPKAKAAPRKRVKKEAEDGGDDDEFGEKPKKKAKTPTKKQKAKKDSPVASEAEDNDTVRVKGEEGAEEGEEDPMA